MTTARTSARPGRRAPTMSTTFGARLGAALTLVALIDGAPVGFASLKRDDAIDLLYVDPRFAGAASARPCSTR